MKTLDQFISDWTGKGIDYDGAYGFQSNDGGVGKFSQKLYRNTIPNFYSLFKSSKVSNMNIFTLNHNSARVRISKRSIFNKIYSLVVTIPFMIRTILSMGGKSKIFSSIIKNVSVYMIYFKIIGGVHDKSMHKYFPLSSIFTNISSSIMFICKNVPLKGVNFFKVGVVNYCYKTLSKFNFFHNSYYITSTHMGVAI